VARALLQRRKTQLKSLLFISGCECGSQGLENGWRRQKWVVQPRHNRKREVSTNREMHLNLIWRSVFRFHSSATVSTIRPYVPFPPQHPCLYLVVHKLTLSLFTPLLIHFLRGHRRRHLARCWRFVNSKSFNNFTFQQLVLVLQKRSNKLAYLCACAVAMNCLFNPSSYCLFCIF